MRTSILTLLCLLWFSTQDATAQPKMRITLTDGQTITLSAADISHISIEPVVPEALSRLAGQWRLIASANGTEGEGGIHTATADTIAFTATVAPDGMGLLCQADRFYTRSGQTYPATWRMLMEEDGNGHHRLGWVLDTAQPVSPKEFDEPAAKYLDNGFFYWGDGTEAHHYIYLLTENINTQRLEGMTLWSGWNTTQTTYAFPQNQEVYGVVSTTIPYQGGSAVGYLDIWASPRFERLP